LLFLPDSATLVNFLKNRDRLGPADSLNLVTASQGLLGRHIGKLVGCALDFRPARRPYYRLTRRALRFSTVGVVLRNAVRSLWAEPRAPHPPTRVWRDWVLVAVLVLTALLEGLLREQVEWRPVALVLAVALAWTLLWRRTHPLAVVAVTFGAVVALDIAVLVAGAEPVGLDTMIFVVLLPYSLVRWGAGREIGIGLVFISTAIVLGLVVDFTGIVEAVIGGMFLLFPATLGASVRYWTSARNRERDQVKLREREQLARELHDSVAHHVSAIAIRAQAGRVVAASHPGAAMDALEVIEGEASRTLAELRIMVGALRTGGEPDRAPQRGVADIERLASLAGEKPRVEVELSGDLEDLRPAVEAAIYRLAQESITNAIRHARHASRIDVQVAGDDGCVRLTVRDDGDFSPFDAGSSTGYGLVGMTERATLLGGTLEAGPSPDRGWTVTAVLPRGGTRT